VPGFRSARVNANTPQRTTVTRPLPRGVCPYDWARLLKRVFDIDMEHCSQCGGTLKIIAAIEHPPVIAKILTHLGLPPGHRPDPRRGC
jgi:hypothetical protein